MADFSLKPIIMFFVVILIGIVFLSEIADNQVKNTELSAAINESITMTATTNTVVNETITITSGTGTTDNTSVRSVTFFGNGTNSTHLADVNITQHVNFSKSGAITISGQRFPADGEYNISYTYTIDVTGNTVNDDVVSLSFFGNGTNNTFQSSITIGAQVNFTKPGVITVDSLPFDPGVYNISYQYEGELYVVDTKTHPLLKLLTVFFVLVIFAFGFLAIRESSDDFNFGFKKK